MNRLLLLLVQWFRYEFKMTYPIPCSSKGIFLLSETSVPFPEFIHVPINLLATDFFFKF